MKFVFIAVNYNGLQFTCDYIRSICSINIADDDSVEIIIVDNNSNKKGFEELKSFCVDYDKVKLIRLDENIGYFKGLNEGICRVKKNENTILIIGNNDLTFSDDFLLNYKEIAIEDDVLIIAPNITTKDGRQQNPHVVEKVGAFEKIKARIYYSNYYVGQSFRFLNRILSNIRKKNIDSYTNSYGQMKIKRGIGACYIMIPRFFEYFDKLDDSVFLWGEEALLSNQVESVSGATLYTPTLRITHHESASVNKIESRNKYKITKSSYQIYRKYL